MAGAHGSQGTERSCRFNSSIIAHQYNMSMITYGVEEKGVRGEARRKTRNQKLETRRRRSRSGIRSLINKSVCAQGKQPGARKKSRQGCRHYGINRDLASG